MLLPTSRKLALVSQALAAALPLALPALLLMALSSLAFAAVGMALFRGAASGHATGAIANFNSLPRALLTVALVVMGDDWHAFADDLSTAPPLCTPASALLRNDTALGAWRYGGGGDCGSPYALAYFLLLKALVSGALLSMVVGSMVQAIDFVAAKSRALGPYAARRVQVEPELQRFADHWRHFDPACTGRIKVPSALPAFRYACLPPSLPCYLRDPAPLPSARSSRSAAARTLRAGPGGASHAVGARQQ